MTFFLLVTRGLSLGRFEPKSIASADQKGRQLLSESPASLSQLSQIRTFQNFVPDGHECAVVTFDGRGVTEVRLDSVSRDCQRVAPCRSVVITDSNLISERGTAVAEGHQQAAAFESQQMRR